MKLDVGCGRTMLADIRLDLYRVTPELLLDRQTCVTTANIIGDACHLPFRSDVFDEVICYHQLEHVDDPIKELRELIRVSKNRIHIKVPHRYASSARIKGHLHSFNVKWFVRVLRHYFFQARTNYASFYGFSRPSEIEIVIWKADLEDIEYTEF